MAVVVNVSGRQIGIIIAVLVIFGVIGYYLTTMQAQQAVASSINKQPTSSGTAALQMGSVAPDFSVKTVNLQTGTEDKPLTLNDVKGKKTILYFWATWCPFCRADLTTLKTIYPKYQDKVNFVAIDLDTSEDAKTVADYINAHGYIGTFAVGNADVLRSYGIVSTTTKYALDEGSVIILRDIGMKDASQWENIFSTIISA